MSFEKSIKDLVRLCECKPSGVSEDNTGEKSTDNNPVKAEGKIDPITAKMVDDLKKAGFKNVDVGIDEITVYAGYNEIWLYFNRNSKKWQTSYTIKRDSKDLSDVLKFAKKVGIK